MKKLRFISEIGDSNFLVEAYENQLEYLNGLMTQLEKMGKEPFDKQSEIFLGKVDFILELTKNSQELESKYLDLLKMHSEISGKIKSLINDYERYFQYIGRIFRGEDQKLFNDFIFSIKIIQDSPYSLAGIDFSHYYDLAKLLEKRNGTFSNIIKETRNSKIEEDYFYKLAIFKENDYSVDFKLLGELFRSILDFLNAIRKNIKINVKGFSDIEKDTNNVFLRSSLNYKSEVISKEVSIFMNKLIDSDLFLPEKFNVFNLYHGDMQAFRDEACFKCHKFKNIFTEDEYEKIVGKSIKKFNNIFLENIENIYDMQDDYYQGELVGSIFFDEFKDAGLGVDDLESIGFKNRVVKFDNLDEKSKRLEIGKVMKMYRSIYNGNKGFLKEIRKTLDESSDKGTLTINFVEYEGKIIVSIFTIDKGDSIYVGGLNTGKGKKYMNMGLWYAGEKLKELGHENNLECTVTTEIEGKNNTSARLLIRSYKNLGFIEEGEGKTENSKYIKFRREKG